MCGTYTDRLSSFTFIKDAELFTFVISIILTGVITRCRSGL